MPAPADPPDGVRRARFVRLFDFLADDDYATLVRHVAERLDRTRASRISQRSAGVVRYDESVRRSRIVSDVGEVWPLFAHRLDQQRPRVCERLGIPPFDVARVSRQLTMHGDGDFFRRHRDESQPGTDECRVLTFVYYFHDEPKAFEGGALRIYDTVVNRRGRTVAATSYTDLDPVANSIVFFAADTFHEVLPVRVAGTTAGIGRCTVNGWYHAGDLGRPIAPRVDADVMRVVAPRMLPRLTPTGFTVRPTPEPVQQRLVAIRQLWDQARSGAAGAGGGVGPTHIPTGPFGDEILERLRPVVEEWAGTTLRPIVTSPLRVHHDGERHPMRVSPAGSDVVTALVVVSEDLDRPWPLELEIEGEARTLSVGAGEMALYEGAAIPHGRPVPLDGRSCCTLLAHYCPVGWPHDAESIVRGALSEGLIDATGALVPTSPRPG